MARTWTEASWSAWRREGSVAARRGVPGRGRARTRRGRGRVRLDVALGSKVRSGPWTPRAARRRCRDVVARVRSRGLLVTVAWTRGSCSSSRSSGRGSTRRGQRRGWPPWRRGGAVAEARRGRAPGFGLGSARSRTRRAWSRLQREEVLEARAPRARPRPRLCCCSARARCGCRGAVRALLATAAVLMGAWGRGRTSSGGGSGMEESGGCRETLKGRS